MSIRTSGNLEPVLLAAEAELASAGVSDTPEVVLADAGYWHTEQTQRIAARGIPVLIPPDAHKRNGVRPGWTGGMYQFTRRVLTSEHGTDLYRRRQGLIEPVFAKRKFNPRSTSSTVAGNRRSEWRMKTRPTTSSDPATTGSPPQGLIQSRTLATAFDSAAREFIGLSWSPASQPVA